MTHYRINRHDYEEFHESREALMRDNEIQSKCASYPRIKRDMANCQACGATLAREDLNRDGLCAECAKQVKLLESGKI